MKPLTSLPKYEEVLGLPNKVLATQYKMALPDEQLLIAELKRTQHMLKLKGILP